MKPWAFRQQLKAEKSYLLRLATSEKKTQTSSILKNSSRKQLKILVIYIQLLANGKIPVHKKLQKSLNKPNVLEVLQKYFFRSNTAQKMFDTLVDSKKNSLLSVLLEIANIIPKALYFVFHEK